MSEQAVSPSVDSCAATDNTAGNELVPAELADIREELRRIDGKARDLLVASTLVVTATAAVVATAHGIPIAPRIVLGLALVPWSVGLVQLLRVVRPMVLAEPGNLLNSGKSVREWQLRRWQVLGSIVAAKYQRVQRAVDCLLAVLALAALSAVTWLVAALL